MTDNDLNKIEKDFDNFVHPNTEKMLLKSNLVNKDLWDLYFGKNKLSKSIKENYIDMSGDLHFLQGIYEVIKIQSETFTKPTYVYSFNYDKGFSLIKFFLNLNLEGML